MIQEEVVEWTIFNCEWCKREWRWYSWPCPACMRNWEKQDFYDYSAKE